MVSGALGDDLIRRQDAVNACIDAEFREEAMGRIRNLPSAEPQIIRCMECKYNYGLANGLEFNPDDIVCSYFDTDGMRADDFCSYAERRTE